MKAADLREKSAADLNELRATLARDVFQNRLKNFTNRLDDTSAMRKTRRDLARVLTLLRAAAKGGAAPAADAKPAAKAEAKPAPAKKAKPAAAKKAEAKAASGDATAADAPAKKKSTKKSEAKSS
jgi:large subunit ribosomal protein L29